MTKQKKGVSVAQKSIKGHKPRKCDAVPGSAACNKTRHNRGMYCTNCTAWQSVGKRM